jgi:IclR family acetate operon transcriptional repressor
MATPINYSVVKAFSILDLFKSAPAGLSLSEVSRELGLNVPTAHRILQTLRSVGALKVEDGGKFVLGQTIFELGGAVMESASDLLQRYAQDTSSELRETIHVGALTGDMVRFLAKADTPTQRLALTRIGAESEAYCTGLGKMLLAHLPASRMRTYCQANDFVRLTENTLVKPSDILSELEAVRQIGYAVDREEFQEGLKCVAVPIFVRGTVRAALSASIPTKRVGPATAGRVADALHHKARMITRELEKHFI